MAMSLKRLIKLNDQNSLFSGFREYSPFFRLQNWRAQQYLLLAAFLKVGSWMKQLEPKSIRIGEKQLVGNPERVIFWTSLSTTRNTANRRPLLRSLIK